MRAGKLTICALRLVLIAAVWFYLIVLCGSTVFGEGSGLLYRTAGYGVIFAAVAGAAMVFALMAKLALAVVSGLRCEKCTVPFSLLFAAGNLSVFLFSLYIILRDQYSDGTGAIIDFQGWGAAIMLMTLVPVSVIYIVLGIRMYLKGRRS